MTIEFSYNKNQVLQALRYHFLSRREIRFMIILVNIFALASAVLFYLKKNIAVCLPGRFPAVVCPDDQLLVYPSRYRLPAFRHFPGPFYHEF